MSKKEFNPDIILGRDLALIGENGCIKETYTISSLVPAECKDNEYVYLVHGTDEADMFNFSEKDINALVRGKNIPYKDGDEFILIG